MSGRQVLLLQGGIIVLLLMSIGVGGYFINETKNNVEEARAQSARNNADINNVEKKFDAFVDKWDNRIKVSNKVTNSTQDKIENAVVYILGNLTNHRLVTNMTSAHIQELGNQTAVLIRQFNQTNEVERAKAVNEIINAVNNNTKLLQEFLGVNQTGGISSIK